MRTILGTIAAVSLLTLAACGDHSTASPGTLPGAGDGTDVPTTDRRVLTIDDIEIDPDAPPVGNLFGGNSSPAAEQDTQGDDVTEPPDVDDDQEMICPSEGECVPDVIDPPDTLEPLPEHQPFCSLLDDIEQRPYPADEYEGMVVSQAWLQELRGVVPAEILESHDLVLEVVELIVQSGTFEQDDDILDALGAEKAEALMTAVDEVGEFIDTSCP